MASGIKDKVAILGMGCAKFGERWNDDAEQLMVEAYLEAMGDAGIDASQIDAAWLSVGFDSMNIGPSGIPAAMALRLPNIGVTKVENYCASGTEAFRGAVYAVASGAADIALAVGVEKLKDTGYGGLPVRTRGTMFDMVGVVGSAPGNFAQQAWHLEGRPQAGNGACLGQEPCQRR
jgi:acetyl-CoA C-acetyltransferase